MKASIATLLIAGSFGTTALLAAPPLSRPAVVVKPRTATPAVNNAAPATRTNSPIIAVPGTAINGSTSTYSGSATGTAESNSDASIQADAATVLSPAASSSLAVDVADTQVVADIHTSFTNLLDVTESEVSATESFKTGIDEAAGWEEAARMKLADVVNESITFAEGTEELDALADALRGGAAATSVNAAEVVNACPYFAPAFGSKG